MAYTKLQSKVESVMILVCSASILLATKHLARY